MIPLFFLFLSMGAAWLAFDGPGSRRHQGFFESSSMSPYSEQVENRVNQHLFFTSQQHELRSKEVALQNEFMAPQIGDVLVPPAKAKSLDFSSDSQERQVVEDLNLNKKKLNYTSPHNQVQGELFDQEKIKEYEDSYRAEYARQFLENARRHGYAIKLSSDYKVLSIEAINPGTKKEGPVIDPQGRAAQ